MVLLDTGIVYAAYDRRDRWHRAAAELIRRHAGRLVLPTPVVPEVDHLLEKRLGSQGRRAFYRGIQESAYLLEELPRAGYARAFELDRRFGDLAMGFVDAAVVAVAEHLELRRIATTDRRHFEPLAAALGLTLLPESGPQ